MDRTTQKSTVFASTATQDFTRPKSTPYIAKNALLDSTASRATTLSINQAISIFDIWIKPLKNISFPEPPYSALLPRLVSAQNRFTSHFSAPIMSKTAPPRQGPIKATSASSANTTPQRASISWKKRSFMAARIAICISGLPTCHFLSSITAS